MLIDGEFSYRRGVLACEDVPLTDIAREHGTPAYIYSRAAIVSRFRQYERALEGGPHRICFAVKANSNLAVLQTLSSVGAGFDIVSGGELFRVLAAGAPADRIVFSGVGKTDEEISYALSTGIHSFNCESERELYRISELAERSGSSASVALRVNPDVDAATHPYISTGLREHKFGVDLSSAEAIYRRAASLRGIRMESVSCHIGSQLLDAEPLLDAADKVLSLIERLRDGGSPIRYLDLGGGLGVPYRPGEQPPTVNSFVQKLRLRIAGLGLTLILEPGRSIVAEAGILLTSVLLTKQNGSKRFVVVDAGMNDLLRPALYGAHHEILPVEVGSSRPMIEADLVGPVCETGDFFAHGRLMPEFKEGDLVALQTAGAYGFVLSSNYNSRPRVCELLVNGSAVHIARRRETYQDLIRLENCITL